MIGYFCLSVTPGEVLDKTNKHVNGSSSGNRIRVAFVYKPSWRYYDINNSINNRYYFFFRALRRNRNLQMDYFPAEHSFDTSKLSGKYDIILCTNSDMSTPRLDNIKKVDIPVIANTHDPHMMESLDLIGFHEKYRISCYFSTLPSSYFYRYFPNSFRYKTITYGVEPDLPYCKPFGDRIRSRILLTGALGDANPIRLLLRRILKPGGDYMWRHQYRLRRMCKKLPYVDYAGVIPGTITYVHGGHPDFITHLSQYRAAIAASRYHPAIKYWESTAAGCLTFMEMTSEHDGGYLGYRDGETAVFINRDNYREKFQEYLDDPDDPKWERIARHGKQHTMKNHTNDVASEALACLMKELVRG